MTECMENSKFAAFVEKMRTAPECNGLSFAAFLIQPIQRLPVLPSFDFICQMLIRLSFRDTCCCYRILWSIHLPNMPTMPNWIRRWRRWRTWPTTSMNVSVRPKTLHRFWPFSPSLPESSKILPSPTDVMCDEDHWLCSTIKETCAPSFSSFSTTCWYTRKISHKAGLYSSINIEYFFFVFVVKMQQLISFVKTQKGQNWKS